MGDGVTLPIWALVLLGLLALVAILEHLIAPFLRGLLHRRRRRSIAVLNQRLRLRISPFKLARRRDLVEEEAGLYRAAPGHEGVLGYYANALVHHLGRAPWPVLAEPHASAKSALAEARGP